MRFLRDNRNLRQAISRNIRPSDLPRIAHLFRNSAYRFFGFATQDLSVLLTSVPAMALAYDDEILAIVIGNWPSEATIWLRGMGIASGLAPSEVLDILLPSFHTMLRSCSIATVFYAGSESSDRWLQPILAQNGYVYHTDVIVYEKYDLDVPTQGNQHVRVRHALAVDLPHVLAIDRACFAPQWNKDEGIIGPAIVSSPYFIVAELNEIPVAFAFVTQHLEGRLIHLVRIAVQPAYRGRGIGARLLAEVVGYGRTRGALSLTLNTQAENAAAQRLYEWFGFRRSGERQTVLRRDLG